MTRGGLDDTLPASEPPGPEAAETPSVRPPARPSIPPTANGVVPARSNRYALGAELGRGGMGRVVEAYDTQLGRTVALKEVLPKAGESTERRFRREVQVTARLEHPSIVPLYDSGIGPEGRPYYVMRRVSGRPFDELITRARGLDERLSLVPALLAAFEAVAHAHRRGVIHRDLKPANILVGELGETVVIDWGLAKVLGESDGDDDPVPTAEEAAASDSLHTMIGSVFGTPGFMSPEQARGDVLDAHGDVYALGACLYQLLAGTPPHAGNSATEMLVKTMRHDVKPLAELAPGAPNELVAIVDKALSYNAEERYPHAGALAEDVRRFLTGQLVAAHHYSSGQRVARFARRYRAALAVAALASVAVAVLAWYGVSRIVAERDLALAAEHRERDQRAVAEHASDLLRERQDQLVLATAASFVDSNPTQALATLKLIPARSAHLAQARATAQAAVMRGVAWALPTDTAAPSWTGLSPDGKHFALLARNSTLRVFDLERRRQELAVPVADAGVGVWLGPSRILVIGAQPRIVDVATGAVVPLALGSVSRAEASSDGTVVLMSVSDGNLALLDSRTRASRAVPRERDVQAFEMGEDGTWYAIGYATSTVIYDARTGLELTRHAGGGQLLAASRRKLAANDLSELYECDLDATPPTWSKVPIAFDRTRFISPVSYLSDVLLVPLRWDFYDTYSRGTLVEHHELASGSALYTPGGTLTMFSEDSNEVWTPTSRGFVRVVLPVAATEPRIAANEHYLVAVSHGSIAVFELDTVRSRRLPATAAQSSAFFGSDTLAVWRQTDFEVSWIDVPSATVVATLKLPGPVEDAVVDADGRSIVLTTGGKAEEHQLWLASVRASHAMLLGAGVTGSRAGLGVLGGGRTVVMYSLGDATVRYRIDGGREEELVKVDGPVVDLAQVGPDRVAVLGERGELAFATFSTHAVERHRLAAPVASLRADPTSGVLYASRNTKLLEWQTDHFAEIAELPRPIAGLHWTQGGIAVVLENLALHLWVPSSRTLASLMAPGIKAPIFSADGSTVATVASPTKLQIVDVPSRAAWTAPIEPGYSSQRDVLALSNDGRRLVAPRYDVAMVVDLGHAAEDLAGWLDHATNAQVDSSGQLVWPFDAP